VIYGSDIISPLHEKINSEDSAASSHWRLWHEQFKVDADMKLISASGFGDGRPLQNEFTQAIHNFLQKRYVKKIDANETFYQLKALASAKCKQNNTRFSLDTLRQVLTLTHLMNTSLAKFTSETIIVIGDGYGVLSHLLLSSGFSRKVVLISLTKTLFADALHLLNCDEFQHSRAITIVDNVADMRMAKADPEIKVVLVEAMHSNILYESGADVAFNIAAMQEMNYLDIQKYFDQMRVLASSGDFTFYCCGRESKALPDGQVIQFEKYPWNENDIILFDEPCSWHDKYYRYIIPIYLNYDGVHRHRLTKMSPNQ
jgi:hypothetical protein